MHKNTFGCWLFLTLSTDMYWYILRNKKVHTEKKFKRNTNDWSENEISLERIITPKYWFLVIVTIFFRFFRSSFLPIKTIFWLLHEVKSFANYLKKKKQKKRYTNGNKNNQKMLNINHFPRVYLYSFFLFHAFFHLSLFVVIFIFIQIYFWIIRSIISVWKNKRVCVDIAYIARTCIYNFVWCLDDEWVCVYTYTV